MEKRLQPESIRQLVQSSLIEIDSKIRCSYPHHTGRIEGQ